MATDLILVTGASSDIGCAFVRRILERGDGPTVLAHSFASGDKLRLLESEFGSRLQPLQADFSKRASVEAMAEQITSQYGVPSAMIHLPALRLTYERFTKFNWDRFETDMAIQVESAVILLQRLLPGMAKLPRARVIFVLSSVVHGMPPKFMSMYTMTKYTQLGLMRSLAAEYASGSVRINAISPSMVETRFLQEVSDTAVQMSAAANPQHRNATPEDLLGAIDLLLSPASDYIHGVDIPITAGTVC